MYGPGLELRGEIVQRGGWCGTVALGFYGARDLVRAPVEDGWVGAELKRVVRERTTFSGSEKPGGMEPGRCPRVGTPARWSHLFLCAAPSQWSGAPVLPQPEHTLHLSQRGVRISLQSERICFLKSFSPGNKRASRNKTQEACRSPPRRPGNPSRENIETSISQKKSACSTGLREFPLLI